MQLARRSLTPCYEIRVAPLAPHRRHHSLPPSVSLACQRRRRTRQRAIDPLRALVLFLAKVRLDLGQVALRSAMSGLKNVRPAVLTPLVASGDRPQWTREGFVAIRSTRMSPPRQPPITPNE